MRRVPSLSRVSRRAMYRAAFWPGWGDIAILWMVRIAWNVSNEWTSGMSHPRAILEVDRAIIVIRFALWVGQVSLAVLSAACTIAARRLSNSGESDTVLDRS